MSHDPSQPSFAPRPEADAVSFEVVVVPRASRSRIVGLHDGCLKVTLAAPPVDGEANAELCATLAKALGVSKRAVSITHGEHNKHKTVRVNGTSLEQVMHLSQSTST